MDLLKKLRGFTVPAFRLRDFKIPLSNRLQLLDGENSERESREEPSVVTRGKPPAGPTKD